MGIFIEICQNLEEIQTQMADAIVQLANDEKMRLQLGENGYRYVNEELTWERKYRKIYIEDYNC